MIDKIIKNKRFVLFAILFLVFTGTSIRWQYVGKYMLWTDELFNVSAAQSMLETGKPDLQSGYTYTRALPYTYIIAASFKLFGVGEESARLPGIFFAILSIPMIFLLGRELVSKWTGLIAAFILTFHSYNIIWSVQGRMYSMAQFIYIFILYALFKAFVGFKKNILQNCLWVVFALSAFFLCVEIQDLTLLFLPALFINVLIYIIWKDLQLNSFLIKRTLIIKYILIFAMVGVAVYIDAVFGKNWIIGQISHLRGTIPTWAMEYANNVQYYRYFFQENFPVLFCLFPFAVTLIILKKTMPGVFLAINFIVPVLLLSISTWKTDRYIYLFMPGFFIIMAFFIEQIFDIFYACLKSVSNSSLSGKKKIILAIVFYLSVFCVLIGPKFRLIDKDFLGIPKQSTQRIVSDFMNRLDSDITTISLEPLFFHFYFKRFPDYVMPYYSAIKQGDFIIPDTLGSNSKDKSGKVKGYNFVRTVSELREIENNSSRVCIIGIKNSISDSFLGTELKDYILANYLVGEDKKSLIHFQKDL